MSDDEQYQEALGYYTRGRDENHPLDPDILHEEGAGIALDQYIGTWFGAWAPYDGPLHVEVIFYMKRGKTVTRELPSVKPDIDKLMRALNDMLTISGLIKDDARITSYWALKRYDDNPRTVIRNIREDKP